MTLENTVNYEGLLEIVVQHFKGIKFLLEELVQVIAIDIKKRYSQVSYLEVAIRKNNPPFGYEIESSEVRIEENYKI